MENCLNKAELLEKFNLCYDSLNKILNYLKLDAKTKCMKEHNVKIISKKRNKTIHRLFQKKTV